MAVNACEPRRPLYGRLMSRADAAHNAGAFISLCRRSALWTKAARHEEECGEKLALFHLSPGRLRCRSPQPVRHTASVCYVSLPQADFPATVMPAGASPEHGVFPLIMPLERSLAHWPSR